MLPMPAKGLVDGVWMSNEEIKRVGETGKAESLREISEMLNGGWAGP